MLEKWKLSIDKKVFACGILMDLSKAFNAIIIVSKTKRLWIYQTGFSCNL